MLVLGVIQVGVLEKVGRIGHAISGMTPLMLAGGWYSPNTQQIGTLLVRMLAAAAWPVTIALRSKSRCK